VRADRVGFSPVRVYFINHSEAAHYLGGAELSLLRLIETWAATTPLDVVVVTPAAEGSVAREARKRGWEMFAMPFGGWVRFGGPDGRLETLAAERRDHAATRALVQHMRRNRPDVVVTNTMVVPWGALAAAELDLPHVWFVREFGDESHGFQFPIGREPVLRAIGELSSRVVANSHALAAELAHSVDATRISVAYPTSGYDDLVAATAPRASVAAFQREGVDLRVAVVGRVTSAKGQWVVVEALGLLLQRGLRVAACFVGSVLEPGLDRQLQRRATKLGLADLVEFTDERADPWPFVRAADVGVTASDREYFGRATFEYLGLGKPAIATRSGGSPELVVDGECGALVEPNSPLDLADALENYARDPELVARHGEAARRRATALARLPESPARAVEMMIGLRGSGGVPMPPRFRTWLDEPPAAAPVLSSVRLRARRLAWRAKRFARNPISAVARR